MGRQSHSKFKFQYLNLRQMFAGRKSNLLYNFLCHVLNEKKTFKKKFSPVFNQNEYKIYLFYIDYFTIRINIHISCSFLLNSRVSNLFGAWITIYLYLYVHVSVCCLKISRPWTGTVFECFTLELNIIMTQENIHMQACMRKRNISRAITLG